MKINFDLSRHFSEQNNYSNRGFPVFKTEIKKFHQKIYFSLKNCDKKIKQKSSPIKIILIF